MGFLSDADLLTTLLLVAVPLALLGIRALVAWPRELLKSFKLLWRNPKKQIFRRTLTALMLSSVQLLPLSSGLFSSGVIRGVVAFDCFMISQILTLFAWRWMQGLPILGFKAVSKPRLSAIEFYSSREWLDLRYRVLRAHPRECMLCGDRGGPVEVDHIKPRSKYPHLELKFSNLQVLCRACNRGKSNLYEDDFRVG